ncbi:MAG: ribosome-associated protein [Bermanella sp.]|jgi:ribosome-associated protein|uniref:alternative ribosome rescue aminoacyl-tRNA hydrolase ArfB n=1 Tax=Glaciecola sp. 33A TaxID=2057807 RepID=UPI000C320A21|nr:alternative ribosome rescue aminoacyl-tRNA hydrolase ArfB [Glaciecola sp. 33A]PKI03150.1 aminoacyl-tRNA hydrolase [Glaciecola sp. 33A]
MAVFITHQISIDESEFSLTATRSQGAGGQHVNKVATAIYLRFDINQSSLPEKIKTKLLESNDTRITSDGVMVLRAQNHRTQEQNKRDAIKRLAVVIKQSTYEKPVRKPTRPSRSSQRKRMDSKTKSGQQKQLRKKIDM